MVRRHERVTLKPQDRHAGVNPSGSVVSDTGRAPLHFFFSCSRKLQEVKGEIEALLPKKKKKLA